MNDADHIDDIDAIQIGPDPDKLLVYHRQQLSAMLDGELSPDQAKFMLRRLQHDGELAACWDRWQVCGDMLRGRHHALLPSDFASRVATGIAGDAHVGVAVAAARPSSRRLRWGGGAALAASVALVAVFAPRMMPDGAEPAPSPLQSPVLAASSPAAMETTGTVATVANAAAGDESPVLPAPVEVAPAALATALAVAEAPRRAAERRARTQEQRVASASQQVRAVAANPPIILAAADLPPTIDTTMPQAAFPSPATLQPRPWPRAIVPGSGDPAFSVGYGRLPSSPHADDSAYDPFFRPRVAPVLLLPPADAEPGDREPMRADGGSATQ